MKEQDAAHSFDTTLKPTDAGYKWVTCSVCDGSGRMSQDQYIELTRLRSELQQKDEIIKELIVVAARISMQLKNGDSYRVHIESLIKKANVF